MVWCWLFEYD